MRHRIAERTSPRFSLALAAACAFGAAESGSAQTFVPARLIALEGQPLCPSNVRESSVLTCQVVVDEAGDANDERATHCFGKLGGDDRRRADTLRRNVVRSRFEPASIDGEDVKVYVSLRVAFLEINGRCDVTIYPNLADQQGELAVDYFAPQEFFADGGWKAAAGPLRYEVTGVERHSGMAFAMSVAVDSLGNASDGRIEVNNFTYDESVQRAVEALERQRFIPAVVNGVARPARYFEFIYIAEPPRPRLR
jgi:hypothetical protein